MITQDKTPAVLFVDDDKFYVDTLIRSIRQTDGEIEFLRCYNLQDALKTLKDPKNEIIFAIVDNNLDGNIAGADISKRLNKERINHILLSSNCTVDILNAAEEHPHCVNVFEKNSIKLTVFQLSKSIQNAQRNIIALRSRTKTAKVAMAQGMLMSRHKTNEADAKRAMQRLATKGGMDVKKFAQSVLDEHSQFLSD